jgi:ABC-type transport system substrate-binding protein
VGKRISPGSTNYQALLISMVGTAVSPVDYFSLFHSTGEHHFFKFSDGQGKDVADYQKRVDEALTQLSREVDEARQKTLASEFQKLVSENVPVIWLFSPGLYAAARSTLGNTRALVTQDAASQSILWETFWRKD